MSTARQKVTYSEFKDYRQKTNSRFLYEDIVGGYRLIMSVENHGAIYCDVTTPEEVGNFEATLKHNNLKTPYLTPSATSIGIDFATPNLCDQTSWYQQASSVADIALAYQVSELAYTYKDTTNTSSVWIDFLKVYGADNKIPLRDTTSISAKTFIPVFKADGVPISRTDIAVVDYEQRTVTFKTSKVGQTVTFSGYIVDTTEHFEYLYSPPAGYQYVINYVELQFSADVNLNTSNQFIRFEVLVGAFTATPFHLLSFDSGYLDDSTYLANGGSLGLAYRHTFLSPYAFESYGNEGKSEIPDWGGKGHTTLVFPFNYVRQVPLDSSVLSGMRIAIPDTSDILDTDSSGPLAGTFATATLYGYLDPL